MRFMMFMIPRVYQPDAPPAEAVARMMTFNEELVTAGTLIALDGLHPRSRGPRRSKSVKAPGVAYQENMMKYICLGYYDEKQWETMSESERNAMMDECFAYDDVLRKNGHFVGGEALQSARNATTLRWKNGKVSITDGPYAETKEQLGGILVLEARDLNHAIQLMSKHPGVKAGPFEIRPAEDLTDMIRESERRRSTIKDE